MKHVLASTARGPDEHAALQLAVSTRKLPDEVLLLPRFVLATGITLSDHLNGVFSGVKS